MARGAVAYDAVGYDLLHYFDSGKWGKHVWPCLKEYLQTEKLASKFNDKIMLGLPVTTRTRLDHLDQLVREYEGASGGLYREFDKDFNFLKQHFLTHARRAFISKGTSRNMNTRVGEGFQQEVSKMYDKTNGKNAEHQISRQDENEEPMARIKMAVDEWLKNQTDSDIDASERELITSLVSTAHWKLGSPDRTVSVHRIEAEKRGNPVFRNFNARLREYIARHHPSHSVRLEQEIEIEACKVIYIDYQSTVDWRSARDILRCNPKFHDAPRFDSVMYDTDNDPLAMGQLQFMFRAHLPSGAKLDLATIRPFRKTSWQPKTQTDCPIQEQVPV
ncbi:hypothetical protein B0H17DRAFT_1141248 [Mycena rosella]|uniref:Uncharacterized protein n=1 Tax=Mycena rosella TaxID=1033263 RepID=A0AAD7G987_MYCRO|nr:hypothetical protein B0H17DRAFT_1141248 [Mycena rosella]